MWERPIFSFNLKTKIEKIKIHFSWSDLFSHREKKSSCDFFFSHVLWRCNWSKTGGEGDDRGWDGWMSSLTRWTWVWASSGNWWRAGKPGVLQSMNCRVDTEWLNSNNKMLYILHTCFLLNSGSRVNIRMSTHRKKYFCLFRSLAPSVENRRLIGSSKIRLWSSF